MTHTFLIEGAAATLTSTTRPEGSCIEVACKDENGQDTRLRLQFTPEGFQRFQELFDRFRRSAQDAGSGHAAARTPAAEPTSGVSSATTDRHVDRYAVALLPEPQVGRILERIQPYLAGGEQAGTFDGGNRIVIWKVPDPRAEQPDTPGYRVYLSPGAVQAARSGGIELRLDGEVSRRELPPERQLVIGDPPMDWQDTSV